MKVYIFILDISRTGGTERIVTNLSAGLVRFVDVSIVSVSSGRHQKPYFSTEKDVEVLHMGLPPIPQNIFKKPIWYVRFYRRLKRMRLRDCVIIGTGHNINSVLSVSSICLFERKNVFAISCEHINVRTIPLWARILMRLFYRFSSAICVLSEEAKNTFVKHIGYREKVVVISNFVRFHSQIISSLNFQRIIMVGRIDENKGYERVVPIAMRLQKEYPEWSIEIFGDGELKNTIEELYNENNLQNVHFHGVVKNIEQEFLQSSIFIMTSYSEAMPMVIIEAYTCGLPVIAFENEGTRVLIQNERTGFLIRGSYDDFYEKLSMLIRDNLLRKKLGENAYEYAAQYKEDVVMQKWKTLIKTFPIAG